MNAVQPVAPTVNDELARFLEHSRNVSILRISTAGSVDDGKSTLIGRLLHDSKNIFEDQLQAIEKASSNAGHDGVDLALLTDGLRAEREQGITIDVAYRYFSTPKRRFILADTPGHEQYTRNMATGASNADLAIILIDARKGVLTQTKRHAFIASLLGVPRLLIAVNKMDLVGYDEAVFQRIKDQFTEFSVRLHTTELRFIPISALQGDNVVERSGAMPWYHGETVMEYLENVYVAGDGNQVDLRFPVQYVIRPHQDYRGYAGRVSSGVVRVGDEVVVLPSMQRSRIKSIDQFSGRGGNLSLEMAHAPMSVTLTLEDEIDISRGDMIVRAKNMPHVWQEFEALMVWMSPEPLDPATEYIVLHSSRETKARIQGVQYRIDVTSLSRLPSQLLQLNEIGRVAFTTKQPLFLDPYQKNRQTGNFVLVDPLSFQTVAAGMVLDRMPEAKVAATADSAPVGGNLHQEPGLISRAAREARAGAPARTVWLTGLSGSGKSTIAKAFEQQLFELGRPVYRLDGDNIRHGLNRDLGFSNRDRKENIRRIAEVAKLFNDAGVSVVCSFISPFREDREMARTIVGPESFIEVHLCTPLEECERRDPHGLYQKARRGEISGFTGIDAPYEVPEAPALALDTSTLSPDEVVRRIVAQLDAQKA